MTTRTLSSNRLKQTLMSVSRAAAIACLGLVNATGQQTDSLDQQLQQLKQQYLQTTRDLEQRIAALEKQIQDQKTIQEQKQVQEQGRPKPKRELCRPRIWRQKLPRRLSSDCQVRWEQSIRAKWLQSPPMTSCRKLT